MKVSAFSLLLAASIHGVSATPAPLPAGLPSLVRDPPIEASTNGATMIVARDGPLFGPDAPLPKICNIGQKTDNCEPYMAVLAGAINLQLDELKQIDTNMNDLLSKDSGDYEDLAWSFAQFGDNFGDVNLFWEVSQKTLLSWRQRRDSKKAIPEKARKLFDVKKDYLNNLKKDEMYIQTDLKEMKAYYHNIDNLLKSGQKVWSDDVKWTIERAIDGLEDFDWELLHNRVYRYFKIAKVIINY